MGEEEEDVFCRTNMNLEFKIENYAFNCPLKLKQNLKVGSTGDDWLGPKTAWMNVKPSSV